MPGLTREPLLAALVLLVMALFVASGYRVGGYGVSGRWRQRLRLAAIVGFAAALAAALVAIALWWARGGR